MTYTDLYYLLSKLGCIGYNNYIFKASVDAEVIYYRACNADNRRLLERNSSLAKGLLTHVKNTVVRTITDSELQGVAELLVEKAKKCSNSPIVYSEYEDGRTMLTHYLSNGIVRCLVVMDKCFYHTTLGIHDDGALTYWYGLMYQSNDRFFTEGEFDACVRFIHSKGGSCIVNEELFGDSVLVNCLPMNNPQITFTDKSVSCRLGVVGKGGQPAPNCWLPMCLLLLAARKSGIEIEKSSVEVDDCMANVMMPLLDKDNSLFNKTVICDALHTLDNAGYCRISEIIEALSD